MVLESLINPRQAENHSLWLFVLGFVYASVGLFLSLWVFRDEASIVTVLIVVMASIPLFYRTTRSEEKKVLRGRTDRELITSHGRVVRFFLFFFFGLVAAFSLWYLVLPAQAAHAAFSVQEQTILSLNQQVTGGIAQFSLLSRIFLNNLKVMMFSLLFSFLFGAGALFILVWNSTVISVAVGNFIRTNTSFLGEISLHGYAFVILMSFLRYFIHGIPEILAYFTAGLAGGILSVAIMRKHFRTFYEPVLHDVSDLMLVSLLLLFVAGILEVFVTPFFYHVL